MLEFASHDSVLSGNSLPVSLSEARGGNFRGPHEEGPRLQVCLPEADSSQEVRITAPGEPMKRILFVDDEPRVLEGLQRMLRPQRKQWDVFFANSGEQALEIAEALVREVRLERTIGGSVAFVRASAEVFVAALIGVLVGLVQFIKSTHSKAPCCRCL